MAEREDVLELTRACVSKTALSTPADRAALRRLLKKTRHPFWGRQTSNQSRVLMIRRQKSQRQIDELLQGEGS